MPQATPVVMIYHVLQGGVDHENERWNQAVPERLVVLRVRLGYSSLGHNCDANLDTALSVDLMNSLQNALLLRSRAEELIILLCSLAAGL